MRTLGSQAQECLESFHRRLSAVETKDKFIEIILQVFCIDTVMSAVQPGLQIAEDPMNVQGMGFWMVEFVTISSHCVFGIPFPLIGIDFGCQFHIVREEVTNGNFTGRSKRSLPRSGASACWASHSRRTFLPRDPLRFKIHRSAIAPIHVEGHGRVIADDSPSPACLPKTHRRAIPHVLVFTALAPAHSVER
jgi:hypothetical protein